MVGGGSASVSAQATSPVYPLYVVAGQPVGISASPNASMVTGGTRDALPTSHIFGNGLED